MEVSYFASPVKVKSYEKAALVLYFLQAVKPPMKSNKIKNTTASTITTTTTKSTSASL